MGLNVSQCIRKDNLLHQVQNSVRSVKGCSKIKLDGSQGMVSGATVMSVDMIVWGLERMTTLTTLSFDGTNLLSCMTLGFERLHSTNHIKHPLLSKTEYCRDLGNTIKESIKRLPARTVKQVKRAPGIQSQNITFPYHRFPPSHSS